MEINRLGYVVSVLNEKGGVGKTTISVQLGQELSEGMGYRVCLIDNDPQKSLLQALYGSEDEHAWPVNITGASGADAFALTAHLYTSAPLSPIQAFQESENLFVLGASDALVDIERDGDEHAFAENVAQLKRHFDFIIIDNGPNLGRKFIAALKAAISGAIIIPFVPDESPLNAIGKVLESIEVIEKTDHTKANYIGVLVNMFERDRIVDMDALARCQARYGEVMMKTVISRAAPIKNATYINQWIGAVSAYKNKSAAQQISALAREVLQEVGNGSR